MKKIISRAIPGLFIGIGIGQIICVLISLTSGKGEFVACAPEFIASVGNEAVAAAIQTLLCAIMGIGFGAASVIWEMDNLSIAAQTGLCFLIYSIFMFPIAYFTYWMEHSVAGFLTYFGIFAACFIVIWIIQYFVWRKKIEVINEGLKK